MRLGVRILAIALLASVPAWAQTITGPARVIDGDTIEVAGQRIRLHGIDAPEKTQTCRMGETAWACGVAAWGELVQLVAGSDVSCEARDVSRYGRVVAVCAAEGEDINAAMVAQGLALAYRQFSDDYVTEESDAQDAHLGMWRGEFVAPWDWRRGDRLAVAPANVEPARPANDNTAGLCQIKGNISSRGERIYHVPGGQFYSRTKISPAKGERFFCSEADAEAAGWRASQR